MRDVEIKSKYAELEGKLNPLYGQPPDVVGLEIGQPTYIKTMGVYEIWYFYKTYGKQESRGSISSFDQAAWESYDKIYIYFRNNKMVKWDAHIQR